MTPDEVIVADNRGQAEYQVSMTFPGKLKVGTVALYSAGIGICAIGILAVIIYGIVSCCRKRSEEGRPLLG